MGLPETWLSPSPGARSATVFKGEFDIFANLSKKSRRVLDMAEQDVITPLAPGGYILRTVWKRPAGFTEASDARIAQLVEQRIENPRVGGSNPPPGTIFS
jgi:hypothetical protein